MLYLWDSFSSGEMESSFFPKSTELKVPASFPQNYILLHWWHLPGHFSLELWLGSIPQSPEARQLPCVVGFGQLRNSPLQEGTRKHPCFFRLNLWQLNWMKITLRKLKYFYQSCGKTFCNSKNLLGKWINHASVPLSSFLVHIQNCEIRSSETEAAWTSNRNMCTTGPRWPIWTWHQGEWYFGHQ